MGKGVIFERRIEDSKTTRKMGSYELEQLRGYTLKPESTFYQSRGLNSTATMNRNYFSEEKMANDLKKTRSKLEKHNATMANLPPLDATSNFHALNKNNN